VYEDLEFCQTAARKHARLVGKVEDTHKLIVLKPAAKYCLRPGLRSSTDFNQDDITAGVGVSYDPLSHSRHNGEV